MKTEKEIKRMMKKIKDMPGYPVSIFKQGEAEALEWVLD